MLPGMEMMMSCQNLAVPAEVMQHVVNVESSHNPYAIGVVGGQLVRQPQNLGEAVATVRMLEEKGYNYSLGVAQVNRANLGKFGLNSYDKAFEYCPNLVAGSQILSQCYNSAGRDWGKAFSCYYSGNFTTGYQDGYVQKVFQSMARAAINTGAQAIPLQLTRTQAKIVNAGKGPVIVTTDSPAYRVAMRSVLDAAASAAITPAVAAMTGTNAPQQMVPVNPAALPPGYTGMPNGMQAQPLPGPIPTDPATAAVMSQVGAQWQPNANANQPGRIRTDPATAAVMSQVGVSATANGMPGPANDGGVFVPEVHGPNDPVQATGPQPSAPQRPGLDNADLRNGNTDDAFVF